MDSQLNKLVLIGASTGGPGHLKKLLSDLPKNLSIPIIIAQHMGKMFIPSFVQQFQNELQAPVYLLSDTMELSQGGIYICQHNTTLKSSLPLRAKPFNSQSPTLYNPNIDILFSSAVPLCRQVSVLAILLTGIGHDGAGGLLELKNAGASVIGESEESAIVYGMPKQALELNPTLKVLHLNDIKIELKRFANVLL